MISERSVELIVWVGVEEEGSVGEKEGLETDEGEMKEEEGDEMDRLQDVESLMKDENRMK